MCSVIFEQTKPFWGPQLALICDFAVNSRNFNLVMAGGQVGSSLVNKESTMTMTLGNPHLPIDASENSRRITLDIFNCNKINPSTVDLKCVFPPKKNRDAKMEIFAIGDPPFLNGDSTIISYLTKHSVQHFPKSPNGTRIPSRKPLTKTQIQELNQHLNND